MFVQPQGNADSRFMNHSFLLFYSFKHVRNLNRYDRKYELRKM
jgi:hypothetical protein